CNNGNVSPQPIVSNTTTFLTLTTTTASATTATSTCQLEYAPAETCPSGQSCQPLACCPGLISVASKCRNPNQLLSASQAIATANAKAARDVEAEMLELELQELEEREAGDLEQQWMDALTDAALEMDAVGLE
ncbi:hypothetical protein LTS18_009530, partial [Coniosporium uncinatum]